MDITRVLERFFRDKSWRIGEDYASLIWLDESVKPTEPELVSLWEVYQQEQEGMRYKTQRAAELPSLAEQLDMLWHSMDAGEIVQDSRFYTAIKAIKDKYPKPQ